jgi:hypothetical protein
MTAEELIALLQEAAGRGVRARPYVDLQVRANVEGLVLLSVFNGRTMQQVIAWETLTQAISPIDVIETVMANMRSALIRAMEDGD